MDHPSTNDVPPKGKENDIEAQDKTMKESDKPNEQTTASISASAASSNNNKPPTAGQKRSLELEFPSERLFSLDPVEEAVHEIWRDHPGMGIKLVLERCRQKLPQHVIDKPRIRRAKERIPYRYIDPSISNPTPRKTFSTDQIHFVHQKLQERQQLRTERRFQEADLIQAGLVTMGVEIDDKLKTWTVRQDHTPSSTSITISNVSSNNYAQKNQQPSSSTPSSTTTGIPCEMCGTLFPSRNLVFKHLRDPTSPCGNAIFVAGESLPVAPSTAAAKTAFRGRTSSSNTKQQHQQSIDVAACLWMGDLPLPWTRLGGKYNRLRSMLRDVLPRTVPTPWIKKVIRKGYRVPKEPPQQQQQQDGSSSEQVVSHKQNSPTNNNDADGSNTQNSPTHNKETEYRGFAIVVFRDAKEAREVLEAVDGSLVDPQRVFRSNDEDLWKLPSFTLKVRPAEKDSHQQQLESTSTPLDAPKNSTKGSQVAGQDPSFADQFLPWSIAELENHWSKLNPSQKLADVALHTQSQEASRYHHDALVEQLAKHYTTKGDPRDFVNCRGKDAPTDLRNSLTTLLENLRWPAQHDRPSMSSERYLVLKRQNTMTDSYYADLKQACHELMQWADPTYVWSGIAVTKNFVASPHRDALDTTFQYAISLGDFGRGGELCVHVQDSSESSHKVYVVDTHNKVARVDGRWTHWVRTWEGGDRYSLIFYDTTGLHATEASSEMTGEFCQLIEKERGDKS